MTIHSIEYKNFRNIEHEKLVFDPRMNLICGINGQGKTNALEAICYLSTGRSYRSGVKEKDFIMEGKTAAEISVVYECRNRTRTLAIRFFRGRGKEYYVDGIRVRRASEFYARLSVVAFFPEYLTIVRDGPSARRSFLDSAISQIDRRYMQALQNYNRVLEQRNRLLPLYFTDRETFRATIDVWNLQLATLCASIADARKKYLDALQLYADEVMQKMTGGKETLRLEYKKAIPAEEYYRLLSGNPAKEAAAGTTCYGIHRDDFGIFLNGRPARTYASQGQRKSIAIALKLGEGRVCNAQKGEEPVVLLDDVLSELDPGRQDYLLFAFPGLKTDRPDPQFRLCRQFFITTCDRRFARVEAHMGKRFFVEAGKFKEL